MNCAICWRGLLGSRNIGSGKYGNCLLFILFYFILFLFFYFYFLLLISPIRSQYVVTGGAATNSNAWSYCFEKSRRALHESEILDDIRVRTHRRFFSNLSLWIPVTCFLMFVRVGFRNWK